MTTNFPKKNSIAGFTLIELIIVIVLVGIMAVVAVPKFMNATDDAKANVVEQLFTQIQSTVEMNYGYAQVKGKISGTQVVTLEETGEYTFSGGYPETKSEATTPNKFFFDLMNLNLKSSENIQNNERTMRIAELNSFEDDSVARIGFGEDDLTSGNCYVQYQLDTNNRPIIDKVISGCN